MWSQRTQLLPERGCYIYITENMTDLKILHYTCAINKAYQSTKLMIKKIIKRIIVFFAFPYLLLQHQVSVLEGCVGYQHTSAGTPPRVVKAFHSISYFFLA